eukprot:2265488-Amphidinium_carterae.1
MPGIHCEVLSEVVTAAVVLTGMVTPNQHKLDSSEGGCRCAEFCAKRPRAHVSQKEGVGGIISLAVLTGRRQKAP